MPERRRNRIRALLKGIETGDPSVVAVVNEAKYIQHNPLTRTGTTGLAELFQRLAKTEPRVEVVRAFEDGDFVFAHTDYDFNVREIGFEVFRFEGDQAVEHWDNLQERETESNPSGHRQIDGPTEAVDLDLTEANRERVREFVTEVLVGRQWDRINEFVSAEGYIEHSPNLSDGVEALTRALSDSGVDRQYETIHRVLAEGNFVLVVTEGYLDGAHSSFFDLFRVEAGWIVEHWDTTETVPPRSEWQNDNGKF